MVKFVTNIVLNAHALNGVTILNYNFAYNFAPKHC
jgi:uncharacterized membrane protein